MEQAASTYEQDLSALRHHLLLMAGRVEEMIGRAGRAIADRDPMLAQQTIALDAAVNRDEIKIDEMCLAILGTGRPVATELRFVTLVMKMVTDLERIADLAVNICERAIDLSRGEAVVVVDGIARMTQLVQAMVKDAIDALVVNDPAKAWAVIRRDDEVDDLYHRVFEELLERMQRDSSIVPQMIHAQSVAKWLERMADHSTNLAELVIFMVEGRDVRHRNRRGQDQGSTA